MSNPGARMGLRRAPFAFTEHGALIDVLRDLMAPPEPKKKHPIGFVTPKEK